MRGFDPSKVERKHIRPITVIYGADAPGIDLRMSRFIEVLKDDGEDVRVFATGSDALGYVVSGDMFSDHVCVIIRDASDLARTSSDERRALSSFLSALSEYDSSSTFAIGIPTSRYTASLSGMLDALSQMGALCRSVDAPGAREKIAWALEYAKSAGLSLSEEGAHKAVAAADGDLATIQTIVDEMHPQLDELGEDEIREWMDTAKEAQYGDFRQVLFDGDVAALRRLRMTFPQTQAGYRLFLLRLRHSAFDLALLSMCPKGNRQPYNSFKSSQFGSDTAYFPSRFSTLMGDKVRARSLLAAYRAANTELEILVGASWARSSYKKVVAAVAACRP